MNVIILSAGLGSRLGDLTRSMPKCLVRVAGHTILEHQLSIIKTFYPEDILLVIGTKGYCWTQKSYNTVRRIHRRIIYNFDNHLTQNTYSLWLALKEMRKPSGFFIVIDGDVVFSRSVLKSIIEHKMQNIIVSRKIKDRSEPGSKVVIDKRNFVKEIGKTITPRTFPWYIHSGIIKFSTRIIPELARLCGLSKFYDLDTGVLLNTLITKHSVYNMRIDHGWINVNTPKDKELSEKILHHKL